MPHRAAELPNLSHAALLRLQRRRAAGASLVALAKELGVGRDTLRKRLKAVAASTGRGFAAPPETKPPRPGKMPHRLRPLPPRPVSESEPSKDQLRAMLAEALARTARL
jgi:hypothetical protein